MGFKCILNIHFHCVDSNTRKVVSFTVLQMKQMYYYISKIIHLNLILNHFSSHVVSICEQKTTDNNENGNCLVIKGTVLTKLKILSTFSDFSLLTEFF